MAIVTTSAGRWFRRVVWLGIVANLALALPTIAAPDQMLAFSRLPTVTPHLWVRFAGAAADPAERVLRARGHRPGPLSRQRVAGGRCRGWPASCSSSATRSYRMLGLFDLVFLVPEAVLLFIATSGRARPRPRARRRR